MELAIVGVVLVCSVAVGSVWLYSSLARKEGDSKGGGISEPDRQRQRPLLSDDKLAERLVQHYQVEHGKVATNYMSQHDIKKALILTFVEYAEAGDVVLGFELANMLYPGFCPPELTDKMIVDLAIYRGPGRHSNLNDWIVHIKQQKFRAKVWRGDGEPREEVHDLDWWILFCGVLEELESPEAARSRADLKSRWIRAMPKHLLKKVLDESMPWILGGERGTLEKGAPAPGLALMEPLKNLREYARLLPDHFEDIHSKDSRDYVGLVRTMYGQRPTGEGTAEVYEQFDRSCREQAEGYLRRLLRDAGVEAVVEAVE